jgi:8-oxo-dGTP pyrophosphatase MutT (NUDIX family)
MNTWLAQLRQRADQAPHRPREPLWLAARDAQIGTLEPALAQRMAAAGLPVRSAPGGWAIDGEAEAALAQVARWLHEQGLAGRWRDELLAVDDINGGTVARIERAAVRPLGITTRAVHLVGRSHDGGVWVQQRALDKATDPGLWDTLMGGLVCAGETIEETLQRETWEEAGLRVADLQGVVPRGRITVRRPLAEGYMVEHIEAFEAVLPRGRVPVNQDGEVARFECMDRQTLMARLQADAFTLEAGIILVGWLDRR